MQPNEFVYPLLNFKAKKDVVIVFFFLLGVKFFIMDTNKFENFLFLNVNWKKNLEKIIKVWIVIKTLAKVGLMKGLSLF